MALMTPAELKKLPFDVRNRWKHKCDGCKRVIVSTLIYGADNGQEACSEGCKRKLNLNKEDYTMAKKSKHEEEEVEKTESSESSEASSSESESEKPKKGAKKPAAKKTAKKEKAAPAKKAGRPKKEEAEEESEKPKKGDKKSKSSGKDKKKSKSEDEKPKKAREVTVGTKGNPFREGSKVADAFELAKEGCTVKAMKKFCEKRSVDYGWMLARFKKEEKRGTAWKFTIDDDDMKIKLKK